MYVLSALVGPTGSAVGVDMTSEQLDVARQYVDWHMTEYGYPKPNVEFTHGCAMLCCSQMRVQEQVRLYSFSMKTQRF